MTRFARATGDLHSLSTADIKLIALARTLEVGGPALQHPKSGLLRGKAVPVQITCLQNSPCISCFKHCTSDIRPAAASAGRIATHILWRHGVPSSSAQTCSTTFWPLDVLLSLQRTAHGAGHLHELPPRARVVRGSGPASLQLPGWGARGQDWAEMDRLAEEEVQAEQADSGAAPCTCSTLQPSALHPVNMPCCSHLYQLAGQE